MQTLIDQRQAGNRDHHALKNPAKYRQVAVGAHFELVEPLLPDVADARLRTAIEDRVRHLVRGAESLPVNV